MCHGLIFAGAKTLDTESVMAKASKNAKKPNILVIWGDDIGQSNLSCYTHGLMGYRTANKGPST